MIRSVCVYCSASNHVPKKYWDLAYAFGQTLAENNVRLVYGGGHVGMMGQLADGCLSKKGDVIGVITEHLNQYEVGHPRLKRLEVAPNMHVRKAKMFQESDAIVVLPGGFGTLDETFEVLTWKQIGIHIKPIVVLNFDGFWDPLRTFVNYLVENGFSSPGDENLLHFVDQMDQVLPLLQALPIEVFDPSKKWT